MEIIEQFFTLLAQGLEAVLIFLLDFSSALLSGVPKKNTTYNADFASAGSLLSHWNKGFCLTGSRSMTVKDSYQNALIIGGTGVGKSSVVLIPSLYTMRSSFIVHDPSGELYTKTSGHLQQDYTVVILNFAKPEVSSGYNPLARAKSSSDIQKVASMLIATGLGEKAKDPFWNTQATSLLAMMITIVKKQEPQFQNLYNVRQLLNMLGSNPKAVDALFSNYADEVLFSEYKAFVSYDDKVVNGVIATAKAALQIFADESVAKVTSVDTINLLEFRTKPVALFIQNSVADQKYYSVLTSLFFEQLFSFILGRFPKKGELDIFLLIDEASSLNLPTLPLAVANVRKHRAGIMILVQDFAQLVHHYGKYDAEAIKSNCFAKMFFTGQSLETTKELEQILGRREFVDEDGKKVVRALMTNDEIRTMKSNRALLVCGNHPPIIAKLVPYYKRFKFRNHRALVAPHVTNGINIDTVPVIGITTPSATVDA